MWSSEEDFVTGCEQAVDEDRRQGSSSDTSRFVACLVKLSVPNFTCVIPTEIFAAHVSVIQGKVEYFRSYIFLTVHLSIILVGNQLEALFLL